MATRVTSARFVGRTGELAELRSALEEASSGRPSLAFVAGESGGGKSRLIGELAAHARAAGSRVLSGDCVELGESELPYAPLISALRPLVRAGDEALDSLPAPQRTDLATIVPSLRGAGADVAVEQSRVFEALLTLLDLLGEEHPVLLVIEDAHWADSSTRHFLAFLAHTICSERLLVACTYRSDELHRRHPLRPLLAELSRDVYTRMIELPALTRDELNVQLEDILGEQPDRALGDRLFARSEGNPLFTEELVAAGPDGRGSLPPTLRDALTLRVERLSEPAQQVLRWLACQPADELLLAQASGLDPEPLRHGLREAVSNQIAVATADGSYAFRHTLLREAVYDDLLPGERAERHAALARVLDEQVENEGERAHLTAQVAHHWLAAGDQPAAFAASVRAGAAAERVRAFGEALAHLERALALWERVPEPESLSGGDQVALLARTAHLADGSGDAIRQEALLHRALELLDETSEPRRAAHVLERLARAQGSLNRQDEALLTIERGLELLGDDHGVERAALLAAGARARMLQSRYADAAERAHEALAAARELDHEPAIEVRALNSLGVARAGLGDFEAGAEALKEALARAEAARLADEIEMSYVNLADLLTLWGRPDEGLAMAREGLAGAAPGTRGAEWLSLGMAEMAYHAGRWEEADEAVPPAGRRRSGTMLVLYRLVRSTLALGRGDLDSARYELGTIELALRESSEVQFVAEWGWQNAELERRSGNLEAARAMIDGTLDRIEFCSDDILRLATVAQAGTPVEADAAQAARDLRDEVAEREALARCAALLERVELAALAGGPLVEAMAAQARAEHARAAGGEKPEIWELAAGHWLALGQPYPALYARLRQAEALVSAGERAEATALTAAALEDARSIGSAWIAEALASLAARARLRVPDAAAEDSVDPGAEAEEPFGLTARERQVLALVAQGATNRAIGTELHMAEKTASVHVSRILAKLDVRSRTEAAAVAHRQGLAEDPAASM